MTVVSLTTMKNNQQKFSELEAKFDSMYYYVIDTVEKDAFLVTATTYSATAAQCDNTPDMTACGLKIKGNSKYVALSRDLLEEFPYGSIVEIQNAGLYNGVYVVADCMNKRYRRYVDILLSNNSKLKHTKLKNVLIKYHNLNAK